MTRDTVLSDTLTPSDESHRAHQKLDTSVTENIVEILVVLARRKLFIIGATSILMIAPIIAVSRTRDSFKADTVILPPQQQQSSLAAFASGVLPLGSLTGLGVASPLGIKTKDKICPC